MAMKVTPPNANIINAVDVVEHILGKDGLIEQNKDVLFEPVAFNEITLENVCRWRRYFLAFAPTYEYLLTLRNPCNFYSFPVKHSLIVNTTDLYCYQEDNFLASRTKNYDRVVFDYGLRPEYIKKIFLEEDTNFLEDTGNLIKNFKIQNTKDFCLSLYPTVEHVWWGVNVIWAFRDLIKETYPMLNPVSRRSDFTHITDITYHSMDELKHLEKISTKDKFAQNLLPLTRISREMDRCVYYHAFTGNEGNLNSTYYAPYYGNYEDDD